MYTIGQISERFGLPVSTLRYYDKQGLFPGMERASGIRRFGDREVETLRIIECLKRSGLEIKDIKRFIDWCEQGPASYEQRRELFARQKETVEAEKLHALRHTTKGSKSMAHEVFAHHFRLPRRGEKMAHFIFCYAFA